MPVKNQLWKKYSLFTLFALTLMLSHVLKAATADQQKIDRKKIVSAFSPQVTSVDMTSPFTVGNGKFAFTADATGLQSFGDDYFTAGFPLETKARWAWHSKTNTGYTLADTNEEYEAYGHKVKFPTESNSPAAQWLRQNPHDLPLGRISLLLDAKKLDAKKISNIQQTLDIWQGKLTSRYSLDGNNVNVESAAHAERDATGFQINSALNKNARLSVQFTFPRGYDFSVKNTPDMDWSHDVEHSTSIIEQNKHQLILERKVDDASYTVIINWRGKANVKQHAPHTFELVPADKQKNFEFTVEYLASPHKNADALTFKNTLASANHYWKNYWQEGAFVDFTRNKDPLATELQRRVLLSQYLVATQTRAAIPAQETGLTSSSWYGKFHMEMAWLHNAHWILWNRSESALPILNWYVDHLDVARKIAQTRGLQGARWPKMVGPDGRESPGGNPLIIWNQPHAIHLAESLFEQSGDKKLLEKYGAVVEETAQAMSSMLTWDKTNKRFVLDSPIWISQEIYTPAQSKNPTYELAYWRYGLATAQQWRIRQGLSINAQWQEQINHLSALPVKDGKYVAMESIPDTFDNAASREDHPSMLAPTAFFNDTHIDKKIMGNTLDAVLKSWAFDTKIWGWDYPMLAMTAARLERPEQAVQLLLMNSKNNYYLNNGHCPQQGAELAVYLPANSSLLAAVAIMLEKNPHTGDYIGFPKSWVIRSEGF